MNKVIMIEEKNLIGGIESEGTLQGTIILEGVLKGTLALPVGYEDYSGSYNVVPKIKVQSLPTADKHLKENVTVEPIPYYEVSNLTGKTIIIGGN